MNNDLARACALQEGCFCIAIAPYDSLVAAVMQTLSGERRKTLYVSGNYPPVLTALDRKNGRFSVRRALTAYQYLTILSDAYESCIIVEHDRSVYMDAPDTAEACGLLCREKAEDAAVLLIARRWDAFIEAMAPAAHTVVHVPYRKTWPAAAHDRRKNLSPPYNRKKNPNMNLNTNANTNPDTKGHGAQRQLWDTEWQ